MRRIMILLVAVVVFSGIAFAERSEEKSKMQEIVVTATRFPTERENVSADVQVFYSEEIEALGVDSVDEVIGSFAPGHLKKYTGGLTTFGMRGYMSEAHGVELKGQILILVDGHRIGASNLAKIPAEWIERIEVVRGPASTLYGAAAMGGVVNIITKKGKEQPLETILSADYGSSTYKGNVYSQGAISEDFKIAITATYTKKRDYETAEYGKVYNTDQLRQEIGANLTFSPSERQNFRLGLTYTDLTGGSPAWLNNQRHTSYDPDCINEYDKSRGHIDLEYDASLNEHFSYLGSLYYLWDHNEWLSGIVSKNESVSMTDDYTLGTTQQITHNLPEKNTVVAGFTYENLKKVSESRKFGVAAIPWQPSISMDNAAVFVEDTLRLLDGQLLFIPGLRYDYYDMQTKQPEGISYSEYQCRSESFDHFSSRVGTVYKIGERLRLRANIGEAFRPPSPDELAAECVYERYGTVNRILGNADLKPETSMTYEVGADYSVPAFTIGASYFYTKLSDKIASDPGGAFYQGEVWDTYKNISGAHAQGIDLNLDWEAGKALELALPLRFYSRLTCNLEHKDEVTDEPLLYLADYEVKSGIHWGIRENLSLFLSNVLVGPQDIYNWDTYTRQGKASFNFTDLSFLYAGLEDWKFKLAIGNLFDQDYEWVRGFPMEGRNYTLTASKTF